MAQHSASLRPTMCSRDPPNSDSIFVQINTYLIPSARLRGLEQFGMGRRDISRISISSCECRSSALVMRRSSASTRRALKGKDDLVTQVVVNYGLDKGQAQRDVDALLKGRQI
jgi:hypothetical protein